MAFKRKKKEYIFGRKFKTVRKTRKKCKLSVEKFTIDNKARHCIIWVSHRKLCLNLESALENKFAWTNFRFDWEAFEVKLKKLRIDFQVQNLILKAEVHLKNLSKKIYSSSLSKNYLKIYKKNFKVNKNNFEQYWQNL